MKYDENDDLKFIKNTNRWPHHMLPVKRRTGNINDDDFLGVIYPNDLTTVHIGMMFAPPTDVKKYDTVEALVQDWKVD